MNPIIVIPARLASTRLPNKPLADIEGKSMIARVVERALLAQTGAVLVAAGDDEIMEPAQEAGAVAILTDPLLPSGSDRVLAAIEKYDPQCDFDVIVNLQGDMPTFDPIIINKVLEILVQNSDADIATLVSPSENQDEKSDPNVVKAIVANIQNDGSGRCLYFTRANAPNGDGPIYRHVGIYAFRRAALKKFVNAAPSSLEMREKLEQLRALEIGLKIFAGQIDNFPKGVDTAEHLEAAREFYRNELL
ncbi:MAG: 3-deoxy-manno-octulosonate cytidylyltransferase (CMP-KDO synthetase) [Hyphomonadaceae bacterium]|nr:MAG: 3-deoxy-manno-octulosonate cytidylyltransferase (CMP-KDO synthetase) [Hyphomonadaceae bacterium]